MGATKIRLDDETEARLARLAERTGRTKSFHVTEATLAKLEDYYLAKDSLEEFRQSDDSAIDPAEVEWPTE